MNNLKYPQEQAALDYFNSVQLEEINGVQVSDYRTLIERPEKTKAWPDEKFYRVFLRLEAIIFTLNRNSN